MQFFSFPWPFWRWNTIWVPGESPCWGLLLLLAGLSIALLDASGLLPGIPCAAGLAAAWLIGRNKATAAEKAELEKMKAKDL